MHSRRPTRRPRLDLLPFGFTEREMSDTSIVLGSKRSVTEWTAPQGWGVFGSEDQAGNARFSAFRVTPAAPWSGLVDSAGSIAGISSSAISAASSGMISSTAPGVGETHCSFTSFSATTWETAWPKLAGTLDRQTCVSTRRSSPVCRVTVKHRAVPGPEFVEDRPATEELTSVHTLAWSSWDRNWVKDLCCSSSAFTPKKWASF
mmetsp:Transcript_102775/g.244994  ORF Transcript_102775/g.244994 Transcript_102775/m.244994 type:complete len:204 (+) Transcript_102775:399-1010(+)